MAGEQNHQTGVKGRADHPPALLGDKGIHPRTYTGNVRSEGRWFGVNRRRWAAGTGPSTCTFLRKSEVGSLLRHYPYDRTGVG